MLHGREEACLPWVVDNGAQISPVHARIRPLAQLAPPSVHVFDLPRRAPRQPRAWVRPLPRTSPTSSTGSASAARGFRPSPCRSPPLCADSTAQMGGGRSRPPRAASAVSPPRSSSALTRECSSLPELETDVVLLSDPADLAALLVGDGFVGITGGS